MRPFLIWFGAVWFTLAWLMLLSLALAARRKMALPKVLAGFNGKPSEFRLRVLQILNHLCAA